MNTTDLHGRIVLLTGAGSGIGGKTGLLAVRRGADLAICDVDDDGLAAVEASARTLGRNVLGFAAASARRRWHACPALRGRAGCREGGIRLLPGDRGHRVRPAEADLDLASGRPPNGWTCTPSAGG
jgi:NAD(P)-dependent dehydrogenase (short-subunit alcohol dehydrogenase family)